VDDGFEQGMEISIYYDPMIAKLVTYGKDRTEAIERMIRAIDEYHITGITTTLGFGKFVMQHEAFVLGNFDTHFAAMIMERLLGVQRLKVTEVVDGGVSNWVKNRRAV
jgi:acetyl-CoA carboxylase biotin carboxylase subunit